MQWFKKLLTTCHRSRPWEETTGRCQISSTIQGIADLCLCICSRRGRRLIHSEKFGMRHVVKLLQDREYQLSLAVPIMKDYTKINKNKLQQKNRLKRIEAHNSTYKAADGYKVFTVIDLCGGFEELRLNLPYNYVLHTAGNLSFIELSYLARCSDLLLLTVAKNVQPAQDLMGCIFRYMPTAVIVHDRKTKGTARSLAKLFGDIKICDSRMLNQLLAQLEMKNTHLCNMRPFMVPKETAYEGQYLYLGGFMKHGLRSDRVIINGIHEGIIEELIVDDNVITGTSLNVEEDEGLFVGTPPIDDESLADGSSNECIFEDVSGSEQENAGDRDSYEEFDLEEPDTKLHPDFDLIERYRDYRGIRNMATCTFKDQGKPEYYNNLVFMKNFKYVQNLVAGRSSAIPPNKFVKLKIRLSREISTHFIILFNLFEYETRNTIHNYEFSMPGDTMKKDIIIDNGYRIYNTRTIASHNLKHNMFQEESDIDHGIVSFTGPISFSSYFAYILWNENSATKIMNGESKDRIFYDRVELTGRPIKFYKRYCVIRGMFHNIEQVQYFSSVRIEGKNNNVGFIKKPLGTKGLFKAYFNRPIKHDEVVTMSLYKRIFL